MAQDERLVEIAGFKLYKPILQIDGTPTHRAPDWMVNIPDITKSNVDGLDDHCQVFDWIEKYSRKTLGHTAGEMFTSAAIEHSVVPLLIPAGTYTALIRQQLNNGTIVGPITIKRIGNVAGTPNTVLQQFVYTNCVFTDVVQNGDFFAFCFRFTIIEETNFEFNQDDQQNAGQNVSTIDYSKATIA